MISYLDHNCRRRLAKFIVEDGEVLLVDERGDRLTDYEIVLMPKPIDLNAPPPPLPINRERYAVEGRIIAALCEYLGLDRYKMGVTLGPLAADLFDASNGDEDKAIGAITSDKRLRRELDRLGLTLKRVAAG